MPTVTSWTQAQLDKILIDEGVVFINWGVTGKEAKLGPTRGGGEFTATAKYRDIPADGVRGKTKGLKVIDELNAMLKCTILSHDQQQMGALLPFSDVAATTPYAITSGEQALVPADKYLTNIVMFCRTLDGKFKQITLYNALNEAPLVINAKPKGENEFALEFHGHWDAVTTTNELYKIENIDSTTMPTTGIV